MDGDSATASELQRHCTDYEGSHLSFWYPDGNLIIQAQQTIFRIYGGLLSSQSSVFEDMFKFPQPAEGDLYEGCRIVELYDSPVDLYYFLQATHSMYVSISVMGHAFLTFFRSFYSSKEMEKLVAIQGILRLSHKYDVPILKTRMIDLLSRYYPTSLDAVDTRLNWENEQDLDKSATFVILNLVRKVECLQLLPMIMYDAVVQFEPDELAFGVPTTLLGPLSSHVTIDNVEDRRRCLRARGTRFTIFQGSINMSVCDEADCGGMTEQDCNISSRWASVELQMVPSAAPLTSLGSIGGYGHVWSRLGNMELCDICPSEKRDSFNLARRKVWLELPDAFGLPPWKELLRDSPVDNCA